MHPVHLRRTLLVVLAAFLAAGRARADHLECYKIKDGAARAKYTADLAGLVAEPGCVIKVPARFLCVDTTKTNVRPIPPGGGPSGQDAGTFLCYTVKCTKRSLPSAAVVDQFGEHDVTPRSSSLLCAPAVVPTTTSTTVTTTSLPLNFCTTTTIPHCGNSGQPSTCPGFCPPGQTCQTDPDGCSCVGPPPACADAGGAFCRAGTCPTGQTCQTICVPPGVLVCACM
jgi:hypothetical protein